MVDKHDLKRIKEGLAVALIWKVEDIYVRARELGKRKPIERKAKGILQKVKKNHNANHRIPWDTIDEYL